MFAQFIHQMFEMRRQGGYFRAEVLLQPFAHGFANRSAGLAIDLFAGVGDSAIHGEFRFGVIVVMTLYQFIGLQMVARSGPIARLAVKIE